MTENNPFVWHELVTLDQKKSGAFFNQLFGWKLEEIDSGEFGMYTLFKHQGRNIAGMVNPTPDTQGTPPNWHFYIAVENVDKCADQAVLLGGKVLVPPRDALDVVRICVISDPTGAVVHLMQSIEKK